MRIITLSCFLLVFLAAHSLPSNTLPKWRERLDFAKAQGDTLSLPDAVRLLSYKEVGEVANERDKAALMKRLFCGTTPIVNCDFSTRRYHLLSVDEYLSMLALEGVKRDYSFVFSSIREQVAEAVLMGTKLVELVWEHNGRLWNTVALVSPEDNDILYDNIGTYVTSYHDDTYDKKSLVWSNYGGANLPPIQALSDTLGDEGLLRTDAVPCSGVLSRGARSSFNIFGTLQYEYDVVACSLYDENGLLCNVKCEATVASGVGWDCAAYAVPIGGASNIGVGRKGYFEFSWGIAIAAWGKFSVVENNGCYSIDNDGFSCSSWQCSRSETQRAPTQK